MQYAAILADFMTQLSLPKSSKMDNMETNLIGGYEANTGLSTITFGTVKFMKDAYTFANKATFDSNPVAVYDAWMISVTPVQKGMESGNWLETSLTLRARLKGDKPYYRQPEYSVAEQTCKAGRARRADDDDGDDNGEPTANIVELAVATPDLSTLVAAVTKADLAGALSGTDKLTVFAPDNAAFLKRDAAELTRLLLPENKAELAGILTYHVVPGAANAADLEDGQMLKTLQGGSLTVKITGDVVTINGAKVTTADIAATNGVVHIIDNVLLPPSGDNDGDDNDGDDNDGNDGNDNDGNDGDDNDGNDNDADDAADISENGEGTMDSGITFKLKCEKVLAGTTNGPFSGLVSQEDKQAMVDMVKDFHKKRQIAYRAETLEDVTNVNADALMALNVNRSLPFSRSIAGNSFVSQGWDDLVAYMSDDDLVGGIRVSGSSAQNPDLFSINRIAENTFQIGQIWTLLMTAGNTVGRVTIYVKVDSYNSFIFQKNDADGSLYATAMFTEVQTDYKATGAVTGEVKNKGARAFGYFVLFCIIFAIVCYSAYYVRTKTSMLDSLMGPHSTHSGFTNDTGDVTGEFANPLANPGGSAETATYQEPESNA